MLYQRGRSTYIYIHQFFSILPAPWKPHPLIRPPPHLPDALECGTALDESLPELLSSSMMRLMLTSSLEAELTLGPRQWIVPRTSLLILSTRGTEKEKKWSKFFNHVHKFCYKLQFLFLLCMSNYYRIAGNIGRN